VLNKGGELMGQPLVQNVEHSINTPKKLRLKEKVAYGLGDVGNNFMFNYENMGCVR
jgi:glycoside/pentoside/hexuronide:cation symporter, GPH family